MRARQHLLHVVTLGSLLIASAALAAEPDPKLPPIQRLKEPKPTNAVFKASSWKKPLEIDSLEAAAPYFTEKALATLKTKVDFAHQKLLIFAWRGSGQDRLTYSVAESYPEQVFFRYRRGRTKDLRPHLHMYLLRANVRWSVK
ncbi:hypothetical protein ACFL09_07045 [Planctomycetota bacterium]